MNTTRFYRNGFTLVEILIVVAILGILAAIVVPHFSNASEEANVTNMNAQLQAIRIQLELYRTQHNEQYPTLDQMWECLTSKTDSEGNVDADGNYGPYFRRAPENLFTKSSAIVAPGEEAATDGWTYDEDTGEFAAVGFDEDTDTFTEP